jgi:hypothetical protein
MAEFVDPRMTNIKPRIRYNTIGGINGPLVVLDNVRPPGDRSTPEKTPFTDMTCCGIG